MALLFRRGKGDITDAVVRGCLLLLLGQAMLSSAVFNLLSRCIMTGWYLYLSVYCNEYRLVCEGELQAELAAGAEEGQNCKERVASQG